MADLTMCRQAPAGRLAGVSCSPATGRFLVPERPIIVFDVNETLLDLEAIRPVFDRIFNDPTAMRVWFAGLITYSEALTLAGVYVPFTDIGGAVLRSRSTHRAVPRLDERRRFRTPLILRAAIAEAHRELVGAGD